MIDEKKIAKKKNSCYLFGVLHGAHDYEMCNTQVEKSQKS